VTLTWLGTASVLLRSGGGAIVFDPYMQDGNAAQRGALRNAVLSAHSVFITHGHLDHLASVPELLRENTAARVYCTKTPRDTLIKHGVDAERVSLVAAGDTVSVAGFDVSVLSGSHIRFDVPIVLSTLLRSLKRFKDAKRILDISKRYPENGETVIYRVSPCGDSGGKILVVMGSLGLDENTLYGAPDVLVLPYQGRSDIAKSAAQVVRKLCPKIIVLDHFDDAFPPISRFIDPSKFIKTMSREFPDAQVIIPQIGKEIEL